MLERPKSAFRELQEITIKSDTRDILSHATKQAESYEDYFLVDIDAHVTETQFWPEIIASIDNEVIRQMGESQMLRPGFGQSSLLNVAPGMLYQHAFGRIPHQAALAEPVDTKDCHHFTELARRSMDALGLDYQIVFPTPMLTLGMHPQDEVEVALSRAYNRWMTDRILPEDERIKGLLYLPFNTPEACEEMVKEHAGTSRHHRLHDHLDAQQAGASQQIHAALFVDRGDRQAAGVPFRLQLERSVVLPAQSLHLHARAVVRALQPDPHDQLDHQRAAGALPQAQAGLGREWARPGFRS